MSKRRLSYKKIKELLEEHSLLEGEFGKEVKAEADFDFFINSKEDRKNDAFIAFKGASFDRHDVLEELQDKSVSLFIVDNKEKLPKKLSAKYLLVKDSREAWTFLEAEAFSNPQNKLKFIGVTGTNGKSSTTWIMAECLRLMGESYLLMGTMGYWLNDDFSESKHTTPDPNVLFELLDKAASMGVHYCLMEVSSHAISQKKVSPITYDAVAFTSFSRDHLDYHSTMKEYFDVKWGFISEQIAKGASAFISEGVDTYISQFYPEANRASFELYKNNKETFASFKIDEMDIAGAKLSIFAKFARYQLSVKLMGFYAIENLVAATLCLEATQKAKLDLSKASEIRSVPGRLDAVVNDKNRFVFIDYAHTPDALYKTCELLKPLCKGDFIVLFGAGGDRDKGKRPLMAKACEKFAEHIIVSSDNPRTEDPAAILEDIKLGFTNLDRVEFILDRREAIRSAITNSTKDDVILIAGKGHEDYQIIGTTKLHFDDKEEAISVLGELK